MHICHCVFAPQICTHACLNVGCEICVGIHLSAGALTHKTYELCIENTHKTYEPCMENMEASRCKKAFIGEDSRRCCHYCATADRAGHGPPEI
jgi:hypothetical protein